MSFFEKVFKGIIIGAAIGFTGGLALGALGITSIGALGITTITLKGAAIYGAVYGGLQGAAASFVKKPKMPTAEVQARSNISADAQALGKWIFGTSAAATDIVYSETKDKKAVVHVIGAASHEVESYQGLYINDELITLSGASATGDWADVLKVYRNVGTESQTALSIPDSGWPSTARGRGLAHYALRWNFDSDNGKEQLSGGIPTRITQVVKGSKVYDPRLDTSIGGSGTHRADDQSTWEWSDNWALIVAHYLLGYKINSKLVYGVGVAPADIDWQSVSDMADVCDQVVDSKPRYRIGGIFAITQDHENIIGQLESAIGGKVSKFGGKYYLWCPHNDLTSAGTLSDNNIVADAGIEYIPAGPIEGLYNTARGQYVEPSLRYQLQPYPEVIESAAVTEDGKDRVLQQDYPIIQDVEIAQRVSRELIRRSRFTGTIRVVVGPIALAVKPFDVVTVNFRETNFTDELFRVVSMQYSAGGAVIVELLEEDASIYDVTSALGTSLTQLDPDAYNPAEVFALTGLTLTNVSVSGAGGTTIDGIKVSWDDPGPFVDFTEGGYRKTGDTDFSYGRNNTRTSAIISPIQPNTSYQVRARHVSIEGVVSAYVTATITSGSTTAITSAIVSNFNVAVITRLEDGVNNVLAGNGTDFRLIVNTTSVTARHKDANPTGSVAPYAGTLRTWLTITANGLATGYNDFATGSVVNSLAIESSTGSATFAGDISTSGQVLGTGTTASAEGNGCIVGNSSTSGVRGVIGLATDTSGVVGVSGTGAGVFGVSSSSTVGGVQARNDGTGPGLAVTGGHIQKSRITGHRIKIWATADADEYEYQFFKV